MDDSEQTTHYLDIRRDYHENPSLHKIAETAFAQLEEKGNADLKIYNDYIARLVKYDRKIYYFSEPRTPSLIVAEFAVIFEELCIRNRQVLVMRLSQNTPHRKTALDCWLEGKSIPTKKLTIAYIDQEMTDPQKIIKEKHTVVLGKDGKYTHPDFIYFVKEPSAAIGRKFVPTFDTNGRKLRRRALTTKVLV